MNFSSRRLFPEANFDFNFSRYRVPINAKEYSALILKIYYVSTPQLDSPIILLVAGGLFLYSTLAFLPFSLFPFLLSFLASRWTANLHTLTAASAIIYIPSAPTTLRGLFGLFYFDIGFWVFSAFETYWPLSLQYQSTFLDTTSKTQHINGVGMVLFLLSISKTVKVNNIRSF